MAPLARELVALKPDVLVAGSKSGALAVRNATRTIPIVVSTPDDPVASGLANSIARPGENVTGLWTVGDDALVGKRLEFLQLASPGIFACGSSLPPRRSNGRYQLPRVAGAAKALRVAVEMFEVREVTKLDAVAAGIVRAGVQALLVSQGPTFNSIRADITAMVARLRLPAVYGWREFAEAGGLMSYGPNLPDIYRQMRD